MRVMVAADRPVVADSMALALSSGIDDVRVQRAATSSECATTATRWRPDLAVLDLALPEAVRLRLHAVLRQEGVKTVFVVTGPAEALDRLEAGADGVVAADEGLDAVVRAIRTVRDGHTYVPPFMLGEVLRGLIDRRRRREITRDRVDRLSTREREVFALLGLGQDQAEIARTLAISPQTAKTHIRHVLTKLGVRSRVEAAALAAQLGLNGTVESRIEDVPAGARRAR